MNRYKKYFSAFFIFWVIFCFQNICLAQIEKPYINAKAFVLMDRTSGRILISKNEDMKLPMASTTKIMTAIVALEKGDLNDKVFVSKRATRIGGSKFNIKEGQQITLKNLLYGLLLCSGNDAAIAIAEHIGGNVENFVNMMNIKAYEIGAKNTHFANPHGLDNPEHYTTAKDLALITKYALENPVFCEIVGTIEIEIVDGDFKKKINNTNRLLRILDYVNGVKTGYTGKAGKCLVASAKLDNLNIISVVLNSQDHFAETIKLLNYGIKNYHPLELLKDNNVYTNIRVKNGIFDSVDLIPANKIVALIRKDENVEIKSQLPQEITAPVKKDEEIGTLQIFIDGKLLCNVKLKAAFDVRKKNMFDVFKLLLTELTRF